MAATGEEVVIFSPDLELAPCRDLLLSGHTARTHAQSVRELHAFLTKRSRFHRAQPCTNRVLSNFVGLCTTLYPLEGY